MHSHNRGGASEIGHGQGPSRSGCGPGLLENEGNREGLPAGQPIIAEAKFEHKLGRRYSGAALVAQESVWRRECCRFLGGLVPRAKGLALRLAMAGEPVTIGSREAARGAAAAEELAALTSGTQIQGADNAGAAAGGDVVFLAFPYEGSAGHAGATGRCFGWQGGGQRHRPHGVRAR